MELTIQGLHLAHCLGGSIPGQDLVLPGMNPNPLDADPDPSIYSMNFSRLGPFPGLLLLAICDSWVGCSGWPLVKAMLCDCAWKAGNQKAEGCTVLLEVSLSCGCRAEQEGVKMETTRTGFGGRLEMLQ